MGLEAPGDPVYVDNLDELWPLGTDRKWHGDNHLRLIKKAIYNTFVRDTVDLENRGLVLAIRSTPANGENTNASGTLNWDTSTYQDFSITLTGNVTAVTINPFPPQGTHLALEVKQNATGGRTITWGAAFHWAAGDVPTLTATANAVDLFYFRSNGTVLQNIGYFHNVKAEV
jgi:hypothetical protein